MWKLFLPILLFSCASLPKGNINTYMACAEVADGGFIDRCENREMVCYTFHHFESSQTNCYPKSIMGTHFIELTEMPGELSNE